MNALLSFSSGSVIGGHYVYYNHAALDCAASPTMDTLLNFAESEFCWI